MALFVFAAGCVVVGVALVCLLRTLPGAAPVDDTLSLLDGACATFVLALATAVGVSWALALAHVLTAAPLVVAGALELVVGLVVLYRLGALRSRQFAAGERWALVASGVALAPVLLWVAFVTWRGTLLPVYNHDGLAYHLPRAVILMQGHGFHVLDIAEARIATWPCDFELVLADILILTGSDSLTASVATLSYVAMALFAARVAAGWWGGGAHLGVVAALTAASPIAILHSGLHKNDVLMAVLVVAALVWSARWYAVGCTASAVLAIVAVLLGVGTKLTGFLVGVAVLPILVLGARRHRAIATGRVVAWTIAASALGAILLGVWPYVVNLWTIHKLVLPPDQPGAGHYGDFANIWQYTAMVLIHPFGPPDFVWNPFRGEMWWWASNDVWMSHFGAAFSILAVLLVPCVVVFRTAGARAERNAASLGALAIFLLIMPIRSLPFGFFSSYTRYVVFVLPFVAAWTVSPMLAWLERVSGRARPAALVVVGLGVAALSVKSLFDFGVHDAYAPIEYVAYMMEHPESRLPFVRQNRAGTAVDRMARPDETVAFDLGFDTWVYPAYGVGFTRKVEFLKPSEGEVVIPDDAGWVVVDRTWSIFFGNPGFVDMGDSALLGQGKATADDLKVYRQLKKDPRFELVYADRPQNQALFRRRRADDPPPAPTPQAAPSGS